MLINWKEFGIKPTNSAKPDSIYFVENLLNVKFPPEYIELLLYSNGASPEISSFPYDSEETCISEFFELSKQAAPNTILWYARPNSISKLPEKCLPIARDAGDFLVCLNFNKTPPSVEIFDPNSGKLFFVAVDFKEFIGLWHE